MGFKLRWFMIGSNFMCVVFMTISVIQAGGFLSWLAAVLCAGNCLWYYREDRKEQIAIDEWLAEAKRKAGVE